MFILSTTQNARTFTIKNKTITIKGKENFRASLNEVSDTVYSELVGISTFRHLMNKGFYEIADTKPYEETLQAIAKSAPKDASRVLESEKSKDGNLESVENRESVPMVEAPAKEVKVRKTKVAK